MTSTFRDSSVQSFLHIGEQWMTCMFEMGIFSLLTLELNKHLQNPWLPLQNLGCFSQTPSVPSTDTCISARPPAILSAFNPRSPDPKASETRFRTLLRNKIVNWAAFWWWSQPKIQERMKTNKTGSNIGRSPSCTCANAYDVRNRRHCTNQHKAWCYFKLNNQKNSPNSTPRNSIFCIMQNLSFHINKLDKYETYKKVLVTSHTKYFSVSNFTSPCLINNSINHSFHLLPKSYSN